MQSTDQKQTFTFGLFSVDFFSEEMKVLLNPEYLEHDA